MERNFLNTPVSNIYSKPNIRSKVSTQILYGEKFKILNKKKDWLKIKTYFDNYIGYIKEQKFRKNFKPQLKIFKSKSRIFIKKKNKFSPSNNFLYFASGVSTLSENKKYIEFEKNKWIKKRDTKVINHYEKNYLKVIKLFLNSKYLWGGKTLDGIDCSALIQLFFRYNQKFFPRDTKDQIRYCKKISKDFRSGSIIFWKGHVGLCLDKKKIIHAYGPRKKVLIMNTKKTIDLIFKTAKLKVKKISNIEKY